MDLTPKELAKMNYKIAEEKYNEQKAVVHRLEKALDSAKTALLNYELAYKCAERCLPIFDCE